MIRHAVLFRFKPGTTAADVAAISEGLGGLPWAIPEIATTTLAPTSESTTATSTSSSWPTSPPPTTTSPTATNRCTVPLSPSASTPRRGAVPRCSSTPIADRPVSAHHGPRLSPSGRGAGRTPRGRSCARCAPVELHRFGIVVVAGCCGHPTRACRTPGERGVLELVPAGPARHEEPVEPRAVEIRTSRRRRRDRGEPGGPRRDAERRHPAGEAQCRRAPSRRRGRTSSKTSGSSTHSSSSHAASCRRRAACRRPAGGSIARGRGRLRTGTVREQQAGRRRDGARPPGAGRGGGCACRRRRHGASTTAPCARRSSPSRRRPACCSRTAPRSSPTSTSAQYFRPQAGGTLLVGGTERRATSWSGSTIPTTSTTWPPSPAGARHAAPRPPGAGARRPPAAHRARRAL